MLPGSGKVFKAAVIATTLILTMTLSIADILYCDSDRKLPEYLQHNGYSSDKTWYFGRLSFDYYLHKAGFKNFMVLQSAPSKGDFLIDETFPGDYSVCKMLENHISKKVLADRIRIHYFPLRTFGAGAGFYGSNRLPYSISFTNPQKEYAVYRIDSTSISDH